MHINKLCNRVYSVKMTIYAYLRISTDKQDVDNQRHGLLEYANSHKLVPLEFREDTASGKIRW
jgi:DNA invertase Pin-like site-specific DNA recombinase